MIQNCSDLNLFFVLQKRIAKTKPTIKQFCKKAADDDFIGDGLRFEMGMSQYDQRFFHRTSSYR